MSCSQRQPLKLLPVQHARRRRLLLLHQILLLHDWSEALPEFPESRSWHHLRRHVEDTLLGVLVSVRLKQQRCF